MRESMPVSTPGAHILASKSHSVEKEPGLLGNVADARTWAMGVEYEAAPPSCAQKQGSAQKWREHIKNTSTGVSLEGGSQIWDN